jgi:hypothetical protein
VFFEEVLDLFIENIDDVVDLLMKLLVTKVFLFQHSASLINYLKFIQSYLVQEVRLLERCYFHVVPKKVE